MLPSRLECRNVDNHLIDIRGAGCVQVVACILSRAGPGLRAVKKRALLDRFCNFGFEELAITTRSVFVEVAADSRTHLRSNVAFKPDGHQETTPAWAKSYGIEIGTPEKRIIVAFPHDFRFQVNQGLLRPVVLRLPSRFGFACSTILS